MTVYKHLTIAAGALTVLGACAQTSETIALSNNVKREISVRETPQTLSVAQVQPAEEMSAFDRARLEDFAARFRIEGDGAILISWPGETEPEASTDAVRSVLIGAGVSIYDIQEASYPGAADAPLNVGFSVYEAYAADCPNYSVVDFADTSTNNPPAPFGCAVTSNIAAVIADPTHLLQSPEMTPPDAGRRAIVLDRYRQGESTTSARSEGESGAIADAVQ